MALRMQGLSIDNNNIDYQPNLEDNWYLDDAGNHAASHAGNNSGVTAGQRTRHTGGSSHRQIHTNNSRSARSALYARTRQALEELENRLVFLMRLSNYLLFPDIAAII